MFDRKAKRALEQVQGLDYTDLLRDPSHFSLGHLADFGLDGEVTTLCYDPVQSLLAVGTQQGRIYVFGAPAVQLSWDLGRPVKVKHLAFRAGSGFLCCVDSKDTLYVFDLSKIEAGKPSRDSMMSMRSNITCIETSASHSHVFLGGRDGTVDVYDIDRGYLSIQARIPNLWLAQEEILRRSGIVDAPSRRHIPICVDVKYHPLDLNLLLIAYEGGVSLWNIAERKADCNWDFVIPPGAPGGGNDPEELIFTERRLNVTSLAWRPDGLMFAVGHEDGCISLCFSKDEMPITIRTLERDDVQNATEDDLFGWSAQGPIGQRKPLNREPIFRLAWSGYPEESTLDAWKGWAIAGVSGSALEIPEHEDFKPVQSPSDKVRARGGTTLTILGGLLPKDTMGIHVLELPPYVPPQAVAAGTSARGTHAALRQALKESILPIEHNVYPTVSPPEDFLLLPKHTPHMGNCYDPSSIVLTTGADPSLPVLVAPHSRRGLEAWSFPPSSTNPPRKLELPGNLDWSGGGTCISCKILNFPTLAYKKLLHQFEEDDKEPYLLPLRGGLASPVTRPYKPTQNIPLDTLPRIMVTSHVDLTVRFWDVTSQLLCATEVSDDPTLPARLDKDFPRPLKHLTFDLKETLTSREASGLEASRILRERPWELEIHKVSVAKETLEIAIMLSTGDVLVARFSYGSPKDWAILPIPSPLDPSLTTGGEISKDVADSFAQMHVQGDKMTQSSNIQGSKSSKKDDAPPQISEELEPQDLYHDLSSIRLSTLHRDGFHPTAAFTLPPPSTSSCLVLSDVGFLGASSDAHVILVDMRGPDVLMYDTSSSPSAIKPKKARKGKVDSSPITSLQWTISAMTEDHDRNPRLIAVQKSGFVRVWKLSHVADSWILGETVSSFSHESVAGAFASFVLSHTGEEALASPSNLQLAMMHQSSLSKTSAPGSTSYLWIAINETTLAAYYNIDGPRTALYDGGTGFTQAAIITKHGCQILLVSTRERTINAFSLPDLNPIARGTFEAAIHTSSGTISFSSDGETLQHLDPLNIKLHTFFDIKKPSFPPLVTLHRSEIPVPAQINVITTMTSTFASLFGGQKVYGISEIDNLLGSPNRPPLKQRAVLSSVQVIQERHDLQGRRDTSSDVPRRQIKVAQDQLDSTQSIMGRTQEALSQRGEYLGALQERLGSMADEASKFANETKKMAQAEAAKRSIQGSFWNIVNK